jgi:polyhydroxyalkanoate synthesis regulator phasin
MVEVVEKAQSQDMSSDPNQTVQAFIDLCARHENNFYKFVHEVHIHDDGLFEKLMGWLEGILSFLRSGPKSGPLDMNRLVEEAVLRGDIDGNKAKEEIDQLIKWQAQRRKWHEDKTRQKMASGGDMNGWLNTAPDNAFTTSDFHLNETDLDDLNNVDDDNNSSDEDESDDQADPIEAEKRRRKKKQDHLRRSAGEPEKPEISEILKLQVEFLLQLRNVLAE